MPFSEGNAANPNVATWNTTASAPSVAAAPILVSYEVSGDVYTLSRVGIAEIEDNANKGEFALNGYDAYVDATEGLMTDGSIKQSDKTGHGTSDMKIYTQADTNGLKKAPPICPVCTTNPPALYSLSTRQLLPALTLITR